MTHRPSSPPLWRRPSLLVLVLACIAGGVVGFPGLSAARQDFTLLRTTEAGSGAELRLEPLAERQPGDRIDRLASHSFAVAASQTLQVRGIATSPHGVHLLLESRSDSAGGSEIFLRSYSNFDDLRADRVDQDLSGSTAIDVAPTFDAVGLAFDGPRAYVLFSGSNSPTGAPLLYLASYRSLTDLFLHREDTARSGKTATDLPPGTRVLGLTFSGPRVRLLEEQADSTLHLSTYRDLQDFFAGNRDRHASHPVSTWFASEGAAGLDGPFSVFWDDFESGDASRWSSAAGFIGNQAPTVDAGPDRSWATESWLTLDGIEVSDPENDSMSAQWRVASRPSGSNAELSAATTLAPRLRGDRAGEYRLELTVTDSRGEASSDTLRVDLHEAEAVWMQMQEATLRDRPLRRIVLPGTHDSATYSIDGNSPIAIDCEINQIDPLCDLGLPSSFWGWTKAQGLSIAGQLDVGVRYFDLRVCWHETPTGPDLFACHGLRGPSMSSVLAQIEDFLDRTEREILILDFQWFYETSWLHLDMLDEMRERFGSRLLEAAPGFGVNELKQVTPGQMWDNGKRVIVLYGQEKLQSECANDEVRSARLEFMDAGRVIRLYDSPSGSTSDDWVEIVVKRDFERRTIATFESSFSDADLEVTYFGSNGLDGKVSRLVSTQSSTVGPAPMITFYEGNNTSQDRVCSISFQGRTSTTLGFTDNDAGPGIIDPQPLATDLNPELWPRDLVLQSEWANTDDTGGLADVIIDELPNNASGFHVIQGQMTGGPADFVGPFDDNLRDFADRSNPVLSDWMRKNWADDGLNVVMVDYIERSEVVELAIAMNNGSLTTTVPTLDLWEGNGVSQDLVCRLDANVSRTLVFTDNSTEDGGPPPWSCVNDEARSMVLYDLNAGDVIRLYDNPDGRMEDDWVEIIAKRKLTDKRITTFEQSFEDSDVRMIYHRNNGLDGKVSHLQISRSAIGAVVDFYEGANGSQNLLCSVPISSNRTINFQSDPQCDNDEARSMVLYDVPAGRVIKLYDSPSGSANDDWLEVRIKRAVKKLIIGNFESSTSNSSWEAIYHRNNGLNGKVSRAVINNTPSPPLAVLYEGNSGTQNIVCTIDISSNRAIRFTASGSPCANDEARSLVLYGVPAGRVIRLYDSPSGSTSDDWVQIKTKRAITSQTVSSFQTTVDNSYLQVLPVPNNGLDGKVSRFVVDNTDVIASMPPTLTFKEGNGGTQDTVCSIRADRAFKLNFKNSSACDNDEARSVILTNIPAGARLRVYDDPGCGTGDDWSDIRARRLVTRYTVSTFESTFSNSTVSQTFYRDNGLNGKVSCIRYDP